MKLKRSISLLLIISFFLGLLAIQTVAKEETSITEKQLNDQSILALNWMQHSGEYVALTYQAFNTAKIAFDLALEKGIENPAVVVDLDETILDNSPYQASLIGQEQGFSSNNWNQWVKLAEAKAIPGSIDFLNYVNSHGGKVFFVSNRALKSDQNRSGNDLEQATIKNLQQLGITGVDQETVVLTGEFSENLDGTNNKHKEGRRQAIINGKIDGKKHNIVLLLGDNLNDFSQDFENSFTNQQRQLLVEKQATQFGISKNPIFPVYIMLPNPVYGDWESSLYDPSKYHKKYWYELTPSEKDQQRRQALIRWNNN